MLVDPTQVMIRSEDANPAREPTKIAAACTVPVVLRHVHRVQGARSCQCQCDTYSVVSMKIGSQLKTVRPALLSASSRDHGSCRAR
jgi:hypothetical protein